MSTTKRTTLLSGISALAAGLAALVTLVLVLDAYGPGDMAAGAAWGGGAVIVVLIVVIVRALRHPDRLSSAERTFTGGGDERDARLTERALAITGTVAIPAVCLGAIALAVGAPVAPTQAILVWLLVLTLIIATVVVHRRG